jgi:hypothetical protein
VNSGFASWGRLFRLSLAPTAIGDVLAGSVLAATAGGAFDLAATTTTLVLVACSLLIYHGGMAFNDWCDREEDAKVRQDRPIPSGAITPRAALLAALFGMTLGPLLAASVEPMAGLWAAGLAFSAALYDYRGRGAWLGPGLLGLCRAMNLGLPILAFGGSEALLLLWPAPALYGAYVFVLSRLGRLEDGEATAANRHVPRILLFLLGFIFWVLPFVPVSFPHTPEESVDLGRKVALGIGLAASWGLLTRAKSLGEWKPADLIPAMGCALRRMLPFSAALAALPGTPQGFGVALLILCLYPFAVWLRGVFPPS